MGIAEDLILIILIGLATGVIANKFKIPPIIGYILGGILIGPHTGLMTVSDIPQIELLAEIGVALLLFSIGLDFSFKELKSVKAIALIGTPLQIAALIAFGFGIGKYLGMPLNESIVLGMVISLSSTMVVLKTLMSRGLIGTLSSNVMIGILIIQDLAAIPLMLLIPNLKSETGSALPLLITLGKAFGLLAAIVIIGIRVIPWALKFIVKLNSRELFLISITALGLGIGYLTHLFGLSLAFGAFVAGMVVNESDYSHQALNDIIPLRDIFGLVFFTSIGMLINPFFIYKNLLLVCILVLIFITAKVIVFSSLSIAFKYFNIMPLALGFGLAQIGEFSFVLARTGLKHEIVSAEFYSLVLSVSVITMIASPFLSLLAAPLYSLKKRFFAHEEVQTVNVPEGGLHQHVVIAGGGRVGFQIASIFNELGFPFIIIEQDFRKFENAKNAGFPVIYGDAGQETVLIATKIHNARLLIITIPFLATAQDIILTATRQNPHIKMIARVEDVSSADELCSMDLDEVVQPEFEASLEIIRKSLMLFDVPITSIINFIDDFRKENTSECKIDSIKISQLNNITRTPFLLEMNWIEINAGSPLSGRSIKDLGIRTKTGVSVVGIVRNQEFIPNPGPDFVFDNDDLIAIIGLPENKKLFDKMINK